MKKLMSIALVFVMVFGFTACGNSKSTANSNTPSTQSSNTTTEPTQGTSDTTTSTTDASVTTTPAAGTSTATTPATGTSTTTAPAKSGSTATTPTKSASTTVTSTQSTSTTPAPTQSTSTTPAPTQSASTTPAPNNSNDTLVMYKTYTSDAKDRTKETWNFHFSSKGVVDAWNIQETYKSVDAAKKAYDSHDSNWEQSIKGNVVTSVAPATQIAMMKTMSRDGLIKMYTTNGFIVK